MVARIFAAAPGSRQWGSCMAVPWHPLGGVSSFPPADRMGHDSHDADVLRSRVRRSVSKKYLTRHHRPYYGEQRHLNWNRSWGRGLKGARFRRPSISRGGFFDREVSRPGIALEEGGVFLRADVSGWSANWK